MGNTFSVTVLAHYNNNVLVLPEVKDEIELSPAVVVKPKPKMIRPKKKRAVNGKGCTY